MHAYTHCNLQMITCMQCGRRRIEVSMPSCMHIHIVTYKDYMHEYMNIPVGKGDVEEVTGVTQPARKVTINLSQ